MRTKKETQCTLTLREPFLSRKCRLFAQTCTHTHTHTQTHTHTNVILCACMHTLVLKRNSETRIDHVHAFTGQSAKQCELQDETACPQSAQGREGKAGTFSSCNARRSIRGSGWGRRPASIEEMGQLFSDTAPASGDWAAADHRRIAFSTGRLRVSAICQ